MRSKKKEKKIYIYKLIVTIIFALAIVFVLNTAQNYIRNEITGKTNLVINNGNVTKSIKNDVIVEDDVIYLLKILQISLMTIFFMIISTIKL